MSSHPRVSVVIPSYNHKPYIGLLIESIYRQSYKDFELIVLDDGSKDGSPEYLKELQSKFNFRLVLKPNEGLCATLNQGLSLARGEFIVNIGSDDIFPDDRLNEQVGFMDSHPDVDVAAGCMHLIDENGKKCGDKIPAKSGFISFDDMLTTNRVFAPTVIIRRSVFEKYGDYPSDFLLEDYYLWMRILKDGGKIYNTDKFWVYYRISNSNLEKKFNWYFKGACQVLESYRTFEGVTEQLRKNTVLFCIKMALLLGREFNAKYQEYFNQLRVHEKIIVTLVSMSPYCLRDFVLIKLKLKTF